MKRTLSVSTAVAAVLLCAACGTSVAATPAHTATPSTTAPASPAPAPSSDYVQGTSPDGTNPDNGTGMTPGGVNPDAQPEGESTVSGTVLGVTPSNGRAGLGQAITYSNGVQVTVDHARTAVAGEYATTDKGKPLVVFDVTIKNGSQDMLQGNNVMVVVLAGQAVADLAGDADKGWRSQFDGVISPGRSVRVTYAAVVPVKDADDIEAQVSPDGGINYPMGLFAGSASAGS